MSTVGRRPSLRTWVSVHLTALLGAQAVVLAIGVTGTTAVAVASAATIPSTSSTSSTTTTTTTIPPTTTTTTTTPPTTTTVVVTTTAAPRPTTTAPPTTSAPAPEPAPTPAPAPTPTPTPTAVASSADEQFLLDDHNRHRAELGIAPLRSDACLTEAARRWAAQQAARGHVDHEANYGDVIAGCVAWNAAGENVGTAASAADLASAFWGSSAHRANIIEPAYSLVGIGIVVDAAGQRWVCELFAG